MNMSPTNSTRYVDFALQQTFLKIWNVITQFADSWLTAIEFARVCEQEFNTRGQVDQRALRVGDMFIGCVL